MPNLIEKLTLKRLRELKQQELDKRWLEKHPRGVYTIFVSRADGRVTWMFDTARPTGGHITGASYSVTGRDKYLRCPVRSNNRYLRSFKYTDVEKCLEKLLSLGVPAAIVQEFEEHVDRRFPKVAGSRT